MLRLGTTGLFICGSQERPRLSRSEAEALLRRCLADESTLQGLRAVLGSGGADSLTRLDDQQIVTELAQKIESGELLLFGEVLPVSSGGGGRKSGGETAYAAPAPKPARAPVAQPAQTDSPLFPANADLAAMAATMQNAADRGAPFCEH